MSLAVAAEFIRAVRRLRERDPSALAGYFPSNVTEAVSIHRLYLQAMNKAGQATALAGPMGWLWDTARLRIVGAADDALAERQVLQNLRAEAVRLDGRLALPDLSQAGGRQF